VKVLSLFSGIGAFEKALDNIGVPYELVAYCDFDKYASRSYAAIHGVSESMNLGDITKVDEKKLPKDIDLITYGFPCQDISLAGKQKGLFNADGTQTRSGLFFEALRIIEETKPRVAIAENVKNLTSKKFSLQFKIVLDSLKAAGYNNYWQVLNAKDYGIPQNRERVFIVSIRKDIDNGSFKFPEAFPLELRLKDMLEDDVDEKFYLDGKFESVTKVNEHYSMLNGGTIGKMHDISRRAYRTDYMAPSLHTCGGGNREPKILVREATKKGYAEAEEGDSINFEQPNSKTRRGRVGKQVAQTLTTSPQQGVVVSDDSSKATTDRIEMVGMLDENGEIYV
jgi:DNA (cytosine-5)-methyltransferase 1